MCHSGCGTLSSLSMNTEICLNLQTFTSNSNGNDLFEKNTTDRRKTRNWYKYTFCEPFAKKPLRGWSKEQLGVLLNRTREIVSKLYFLIHLPDALRKTGSVYYNVYDSAQHPCIRITKRILYFKYYGASIELIEECLT